MIQRIRPHDILDMVPPYGREFTGLIPNRQTKITMLESVCLLSLAKVVKARVAVQFGFFRGETAFLLHRNKIEKVISFDFCDLGIPTETEVVGYEPTPVRYGDTRYMDMTDLYGKADWVMIDAGLTLDCIASDTNNAVKMVEDRMPAVVIWTTCGDERFHIETFLEEWGRDKRIYRIEETSLAFWPVGWSLRQ